MIPIIRFNFLFILILFLTVFLASCGNDVIENNIKELSTGAKTGEQEVPEPYSKAIEALNNQDWELANTYLDLMITDFPNSEYIFPAKIIKGVFQINEHVATAELINILGKGISKGKTFYKDEDAAILRSHMDLTQNRINELSMELEDTFNYLVQVFDSNNNYNEYFKRIKPAAPDVYSYNKLSYFESVGYPVPHDFEIEEFFNTKQDIDVSNMLNEVKSNPEHLNYNFLQFFSYAAIVLNMSNPDLSKELNNIVLDLTIDDPYNEYRVLIEKRIDGAELSKDPDLIESREIIEKTDSAEDTGSVKVTDSQQNDNNDIVLEYRITQDGLVNLNSNIDLINLKINQRIILKPTFEGESFERVLADGTILDFEEENILNAISKGTGILTIIPNGYDWDNAKEIKVVVE